MKIKIENLEAGASIWGFIIGLILVYLGSHGEENPWVIYPLIVVGSACALYSSYGAIKELIATIKRRKSPHA